MLKLIISAILFVLIDGIYLTSVSHYFDKQISLIQKTSIKLDFTATIICYFFLILGLHYFILRENKSIFDAFLLGLVIYMVYETTNKAILKDWSWKTVMIDGIWGGILFALTTYLTYTLYSYLV